MDIVIRDLEYLDDAAAGAHGHVPLLTNWNCILSLTRIRSRKERPFSYIVHKCWVLTGFP